MRNVSKRLVLLARTTRLAAAAQRNVTIPQASVLCEPDRSYMRPPLMDAARFSFAAQSFSTKPDTSSSSSSSSSSSDDESWSEDFLGYRQTVTYAPPIVRVGEKAPSFKDMPAVVNGEIQKVSMSDYHGKYIILFFYPKDFTFVCPTEIIAFSDRAKEFEAIGAQLIAASTDTEECHLAWIRTPRNKGGLGRMQIPILADTTKELSAKYGVLIEKLGIALRGLFIINPQGVVQQITINDLPIGRSVDETLRQLQAIQFVAEHGEVCPADWTPGGRTMVAHPDKSQEYFAATPEHKEVAEESFSQNLHSIGSRAEYDSLVKSGAPLVVDFYAPWCGKCRSLAPFLDTLVDQHPNVKFVKFDTTSEALKGVSSELGVKVLPTFKFFKGGKEVTEQVAGYKKKPLEDSVAKLAA